MRTTSGVRIGGSSSMAVQSCEAQDIQTDIGGLMAFKAAADTKGVLNQSWNGVTNPCEVLFGSLLWLGITCNDRGRVDTVNLPDMQLVGTFPENTLSRLNELRYLILPNNSFSGSLPSDLSTLTGLLQFWAQNAQFSGSLPTLPVKIGMLNLSHNRLTGPIPDLSGLTNLTRLDLSGNHFQGNIPNLPANLQVLNLSDNSLIGSVPQDLAQRFPTAFAGNVGLCGPTTTTPCSSTPSGDVGTDPNNAPSSAGNKDSKSLSPLNIALIVVGAFAFILLILGFLKFYYIRVESGEKASSKNSGNDSGISASMGEHENMKLSFLDESHPNYDLEDLLRASAEMLGKGSLGTAYKAALEGGNVLAVKRLKEVRDVTDMGKKEFDDYMQMLGRLRHPNLVPLRAYYYTKDERLIICDFMPNGSLFSLLHGSRGPGRTPLEWPSRLNIALGVARGLTFLHQECKALKIPHGNLKSSNVLLGRNFEVQIADFGVVPLMTPATAAQRMAGYRAPEYNHAKRLSYKADVYSFGVLLLELLTGRQPAVSLQGDGIDLPRWVQSVVREEWTGEVFDLELKTYLHGEDGMVSLLQTAMACVMSNPDKRPDMAQVLQMIESIRRTEFVLDSESSPHSHSNSSDEDLPGHEAPPFNLANLVRMEQGERDLEQGERDPEFQEQAEQDLELREKETRDLKLQEKETRDLKLQETENRDLELQEKETGNLELQEKETGNLKLQEKEERDLELQEQGAEQDLELCRNRESEHAPSSSKENGKSSCESSKSSNSSSRSKESETSS
ncbi:unnamed protein product [Calypogeia fissa]